MLLNYDVIMIKKVLFLVLAYSAGKITWKTRENFNLHHVENTWNFGGKRAKHAESTSKVGGIHVEIMRKNGGSRHVEKACLTRGIHVK